MDFISEDFAGFLKNLRLSSENSHDESFQESGRKMPLFRNQFVYISNPGAGKIVFHKGFDTFLGYKKFSGNHNGPDLDFLVNYVHPEDRMPLFDVSKEIISFLTRLPGVNPFEHVFSFDYRVRKSGGEYVRVNNQSCVYQVDAQRRIKLMLTICSDISHLKSKRAYSWSASGPGAENFHIDHILKKYAAVTSSALSFREIEIVRMLSQNYSSEQIGKKLNISKNTVDTHRRNMIKKTNCRNTLELVMWALENKVIDRP